jgi:DNA-binding Xre family transcriptional regulator
MEVINRMETTFDRFITNDPEQRKHFEEEYADFSLSELIKEGMAERKLSVRELAERAKVSPTVVQKMRGKDAVKVSYRTFSKVLDKLGYGIRVEKKQMVRSGLNGV